MKFEPYTTIYFCSTGIDDNNKVVCKSQTELYNAITRGSNVKGKTEDNSFQRNGPSFVMRVSHDDIPYYTLLLCDTVMYDNTDNVGHFWTVGNIISVEWKNPDCSFVYFKVDNFMTYQVFIDWAKTHAYIEREHIKEDWASDGGHPLFSNMGPAEDFSVAADTPVYTKVINFEVRDQVLVYSPYKTNGEAVFEGTVKGGLYTSLQSKVMTPTEANQFFRTIADKKGASINNIVGVYGVPDEVKEALESLTGEKELPDEDLEPIDEAIAALKSPYELNNAKCLSAPFFNIRLMSSEGQSIDFTPQWFGSDIGEYTLKTKIGTAGKQFGGIAATFENKNGTFNWKAWNDLTVYINNLPACPWTGDGFREWQSINGMATTMQAVSATNKAFWNVAGIGERAIGGLTNPRMFDSNNGSKSSGLQEAAGLVTTAVDFATTITNLGATIKQAKATGATVQGVGGFSSLFDLSQRSYGFKVVYYGTQKYTLYAVDAFFDRFGYRVNMLKSIGLENRPIWTFIKTAECHLATTQGIPFTAQKDIARMFMNGVTMWKGEKYTGGQIIGDFSDTKGNRGIKGV